jgi:hypothetical protein
VSGPFRVTPALPAEAMQTYRIRSPHDTTIPASCQQVGCEAWLHGWDTAVDERTPLGQFQADYIRQSSGRTFRELRTGDGLTVFRFEARQRCFDDHQTLPERFLVTGGDWRGNPTGMRREHVRAADWVEDFAEHQQALKDATERG